MLLAQVHSFGSNYSQVESMHKERELNLLDPEVWIADTGATTHSTAHPDHGIQPREAKESNNVMGVAGLPVEAAKIIDIPSVKINKEGHRITMCGMCKGQDKKKDIDGRYA